MKNRAESATLTSSYRSSDRILDHVYPLFDSINLDELKSKGIFRDKFNYELVYFYPPAKILTPVKSDEVFKNACNRQLHERRLGMYIHLPFCTGHCSYCHYIKFPNPTSDVVEKYLGALKKELGIIRKIPELRDIALTSLHVGGGTPTYLKAYQIENLMNFIKSHFELPESIEVTWESSPETILRDKDKLKVLLRNKVNRLNIGIQSFEDHILKILARRHNGYMAKDAIIEARNAGFHNINIDIMYGLPQQSFLDWKHTLDEVESLLPESVTVYHLRIHLDTPMARKNPDEFPSEEECLLMQIYACERLKELGYVHLQPNQFIRSNQCAHKYVVDKWEKGAEFVGIGLSSYSYINQSIYFNYRAIKEYLDSIANNQLPIYIGKNLSMDQQKAKTMILGLKVLNSGVNKARFKNTFNVDIEEAFRHTLNKLKKLGLIYDDGEKIRLTYKGILFADEVCVEFYTEEERKILIDKGVSKYGAYL